LQSRRHTSFATVIVYQAIESEADLTIPKKDIVIETYRSSGTLPTCPHSSERPILINGID